MEKIHTQEESKSNSALYLTIFLLLISVGCIIYIYTSYKVIKKDEFTENYILKKDYVPKAQEVKIVEVEKIVEVPIYNSTESKKTIDISLSHEKDIEVEKEDYFETYICKDMLSSRVEIPQKCKDGLNTFLEENKDSKSFEVIGMSVNEDFEMLKKLQDVYGEEKTKQLSKYSQIGLSIQRVTEASWLIKKYLGDYKKIKKSNYRVDAKNQKGFIVRAYK